MAVNFVIRSDTSLGRVQQFITNAKRLSTGEAVDEVINIRAYAKEALDRLKFHFPKSDSSATSWSRQRYGFRLFAFWRVKAVVENQAIGFEIYHTKARDPKVQTILRSLDTGSKAFSIIARKFTMFEDMRRGGDRGPTPFTRIPEGEKINIPAKPGTFYIRDTYRYINSVMLPRMKAEIRAKVINKLES